MDKRCIARNQCLSLGLMLILGGCASGPPADIDTWQILTEESPLSVYSRYSGPVNRWWLRLGDSGVDRLVSAALQTNVRVAAAEKSLLRSVARRDAARLEASSPFRRNSTAGKSDLPLTPQGSQRADLGGTLEVDVLGVRQTLLLLAEADIELQSAYLNEAIGDVALEIAGTLITYRAALERLAAARQWATDLTLLQETLAKQRRPASSSKERLALAQMTAAREVDAASGEVTKSRTLLLARLPRDMPLPEWINPGKVAPLWILPDPDGGKPAVSRAARLADSEFKYAQALLNHAQSSGSPTFQVGGAVGVNYLLTETWPKATAELNAVNIGIDIPLVDSAATQLRIQKAQALYRTTESALSEATQRAEKDWLQLAQSLPEAHENWRKTVYAASVAEQSADADLRKFPATQTGVQTVIDSLHARWKSQTALTQAKLVLNLRLADWYAF